MLWASEALGRDGKPAVLLLNAKRTSRSVSAELAYVAATLPEGPLLGRYWRTEGSAPEVVTVLWPAGWPKVTPRNKLHPRRDTPEAARAEIDGHNRVRLSIAQEENLSNDHQEEHQEEQSERGG